MSVPPRWLGCPRKGKVIGGRFLPFKTPLSSRYDESVPEENKFDIPMLLSSVDGLQMRMGLVVDLTKTDRFYDKRSLTEIGIGHYKLKCEGYGEAPRADQVEEFKRISSHFFAQHPGEIIGVHCTHGFNRTGFLIISYLVDKEDWTFEAANAAFCQSRPPGIYKPGYLKALAERLNSGNMADIGVPERPDWCNEEGEEDEEAGGARRSRNRREIQNEHARFVDGVSGPMFVGPPLREEIQQQCQYILAFDGTGFPGSQPISMDVQNIGLINKRPYRVSWKADGTRYMMYIRKEDEVYMVDRDNAVFLIPKVKFFLRQNLEQHLKDTLVDGEMVFDETPNSGIRPRYLIYDIMQFNGNRDISQCEHDTRLICIDKELIQPRDNVAKRGLLNKAVEPFGIRAKTFWDVRESRMVLENFSAKLTHKSDGLIFSPASEPYRPGRCNELLKWKPSDLNSVDFRLKIVETNQPGQLVEKEGLLYVGGYPQPFAKLDLKRNRDAKAHNGCIIECYWDKNSGWNFMRVREDKSFPNGLTTAKSVLHSITQPVTTKWLLEVIENHRWRPTPSLAGVKRKERPTSEGDEDATHMPPQKIISQRD